MISKELHGLSVLHRELMISTVQLDTLYALNDGSMDIPDVHRDKCNSLILSSIGLESLGDIVRKSKDAVKAMLERVKKFIVEVVEKVMFLFGIHPKQRIVKKIYQLIPNYLRAARIHIEKAQSDFPNIEGFRELNNILNETSSEYKGLGRSPDYKKMLGFIEKWQSDTGTKVIMTLGGISSAHSDNPDVIRTVNAITSIVSPKTKDDLKKEEFEWFYDCRDEASSTKILGDMKDYVEVIRNGHDFTLDFIDKTRRLAKDLRRPHKHNQVYKIVSGVFGKNPESRKFKVGESCSLGQWTWSVQEKRIKDRSGMDSGTLLGTVKEEREKPRESVPDLIPISSVKKVIDLSSEVVEEYTALLNEIKKDIEKVLDDKRFTEDVAFINEHLRKTLATKGLTPKELYFIRYIDSVYGAKNLTTALTSDTTLIPGILKTLSDFENWIITLMDIGPKIDY